MRALAHPTRLALLEVLGVHGAMTATEAAVLVGESPSSCSFHLRTLARHGFVEEAGGGTGRQRPWRRTSSGVTVEEIDDPQAKVAAEALQEVWFDRYLRRMRTAFAARDELPPPWRKATTSTESVLWLTSAEARAMNEEVLAILLRHRERMDDPSTRPTTARPVEALYFAYRDDFGLPPEA